MRFSVMPPHGPLRRWGLYRITLVVVSKVVRRVSRRAGRRRSEQSARAAFFGGCRSRSCSCSHSTETFFVVVLPILLLDVSFKWNSSFSLAIDSFEFASTHLPERRVVMGGYLGVER